MKKMQNKFTLYRSSPAMLEMILDPQELATFIDYFDLEEELKDGSKELMPGGEIKITIPVSDGKAKLYQEYQLEILSEHYNFN